MTEKPRTLVMVYPKDSNCGVRDYARMVIHELEKRQWAVQSFSPPKDRSQIQAICRAARAAGLVHFQFEQGAWETRGQCLLEPLAGAISVPKLCTLHEVYLQNPMDYPYSEIRSKIPFGKRIKQALYKRKHPAFAFDRKASRQTFFCQAVHVHNEHQKVFLVEKGCDAIGIHVIPHGIPSNPPAPFRERPNPWRLGTFGFLTPDVDYEATIKALARLEAPLAYEIGGGPRLPQHEALVSQIRQMAEDNGMADRVRVLGVVPENRLETYFHSLDLYLAPFRHKSSSGSLSRALSYGLPVIAPGLPLTRDIHARIPCVDLYDPSEPHALQAAIERLTGNLDRRRRLQQKSLQYARAFSFGSEADQLGDLYRGLAS